MYILIEFLLKFNKNSCPYKNNRRRCMNLYGQEREKL